MKAPLRHTDKGFALVATLLLMVLLTIVAVGLLSLSSISLRTSGQSNAASMPRSNARLALMMALGDLQTYARPDTRRTARRYSKVLATSTATSWIPSPKPSSNQCASAIAF